MAVDSLPLTQDQISFLFIYFVYGLAFFTMGIALLLESERLPRLAEKVALWPLAMFGLLHGLHEWVEIFLLQREWLGASISEDMQILRLVLLALSFLFLLFFGVLILFPQTTWPKLTLSGALWLGVCLGLMWINKQADQEHWITRGDALMRYLIAIPGGLLAMLALWRRSAQAKREGQLVLGRQFCWAAAWFGCYGLSQGLVAPSDMFPANFLNATLFWQATGVPVQVFRAVFAVLITFHLLRAIRMVEAERQRLLFEAQYQRLEALAKFKQELEKRETMRKELLRHTVLAQEEERSRIARELHDETAQILTALSLDLATLGKMLPKRSQMLPILERLQSRCREMSQGLYRLISDLRPAQLDDLGLAAALDHLVELAKSRLGLHVSLQVSGADQRLDPLIETVIYRVSQEALANISRHARVDSAQIHLSITCEEIRLQICDQGIGFDPTEVYHPPRGWGLAGMRERVESVGGAILGALSARKRHRGGGNPACPSECT